MRLASMVAAYERGLRERGCGGDPRQAMVPLIVLGATGTLVALAGTPYTDPARRLPSAVRIGALDEAPATTARGP